MAPPWMRSLRDRASSTQNEEEESFLPNNEAKGPSIHISPVASSSSRNATPWIVSNIILAILLTLSLANQFITQASTAISLPEQQQCRVVVNESFATDMLDGRHAIEYERTHYTGGLTWNYDLKAAIRLQDADIEYFGEPTKELDDKWHHMLRDEFRFLEDDEVPANLAEENRLWTGHFHFEPDFFHNLHCLNEIRKEISIYSLYPGADETYVRKFEKDKKDGQKMLGPDWPKHHLEHCMDRIRQALICHGDLTPSIMHRWNDSSFALGITGERTCRKWEPLRAWMDDRKRRDNETEAREKAEKTEEGVIAR